jgi:hypothetical protein
MGKLAEGWKTALSRRRVVATIRELQPGRPRGIGDEDFLVLSVILNAELLVGQFVEYYLERAASRIVVLDNGSHDGTLDILSRYPEVTVIQSTLPFRTFKTQLKRYLVDRYARGRWALSVDVDEHFDFPHSGALGMRGVLRYLNANEFTSVVSYMLDRFAAGNFGRHVAAPGDDLSKLYPLYDISEIDELPYVGRAGGSNRISLPQIPWKSGGIRRSVFETKFGLTKHPLTRHVGRVNYHPAHKVMNANLADFTGVLYHYKLLSSLLDQARIAEVGQNYAKKSRQYRAYRRTLEAQPGLVLERPTARSLGSVEQLVDERFLYVGDAFGKYVETFG